jgi:hypothetical protein
MIGATSSSRRGAAGSSTTAVADARSFVHPLADPEEAVDLV